MRFDVIRNSTKQPVGHHVIRELSLLSFQQWKNSSEIVVPLHELLVTIANVSSVDPVSKTPLAVAAPVEFYLPDPVRDSLLSIIDTKEGDTEKAFSPSVRLSVILLAVAEEITQNHLPNEEYDVRISDGQ